MARSIYQQNEAAKLPAETALCEASATLMQRRCTGNPRSCPQKSSRRTAMRCCSFATETRAGDEGPRRAAQGIRANASRLLRPTLIRSYYVGGTRRPRTRAGDEGPRRAAQGIRANASRLLRPTLIRSYYVGGTRRPRETITLAVRTTCPPRSRPRAAQRP